LTWLALAALAAACFLPLALEPQPAEYVPPGPAPLLQAILVFGVLGAIVAFRVWLDGKEGHVPLWTVALAILAAGLVFIHWLFVDRHGWKYDGATGQYLTLLRGTDSIPHQFRLLPYGFTRLLERLLGDLWLAIVAYRWFFSFWFCWAWVRFAERFISARAALFSTLVLLPLYPAAVSYYVGQLTDPLNHALFVMGFLWIVENAPARLAAGIFLGVFAKETIVILVLAYLAVWYRNGWRPWLVTVVLGVVATVAFMIPRGIHWRLEGTQINGVPGLMIGTNLGIGTPLFSQGAPFFMNYLQPALFTLPFFPGIWLYGRRHDRRLRVLALVVTPAILFSSLCFSWMYESRNFLPFLPLLVPLSLPPRSPD
jgi:hypothetical protein